MGKPTWSTRAPMSTLAEPGMAEMMLFLMVERRALSTDKMIVESLLWYNYYNSMVSP